MGDVVKYLPAHCACGLGAEGDAHFLVPVATPGADAPRKLWRMEPRDGAAAIVAPAPTYATAVHEAAHAVIAFVLGRSIASVTVVGQPVFVGGDAPKDRLGAAAVALAGPHGERIIAHRAEFRPYCDHVLRTINTVREFRFGGCDDCNAAFAIVHHCGLDAPDHELLATYRAVEGATIALVREPLVGASIRALADRLMAIGTVQGAEAHHLIDDIGVEFGSRSITI